MHRSQAALRATRITASRTALRVGVPAAATIARRVSAFAGAQNQVPLRPAASSGARFATGPAASPTKISDELLEKLGKLSTQVGLRFGVPRFRVAVLARDLIRLLFALVLDLVLGSFF